MDNLERVRAAFEDLQYMGHAQAQLMRDLIAKHDARDILEIGFYHGKSSAYFAAILEDLGCGHLVTIDRKNARKREPNIDHVLSTLGLSHRVTPVYAHRSYTWEMAKMIQAQPRPQFDLCYFDGGHTWDGTGFGFLLVDMLLRPGGWIVFDDIPWTIEAATHKRSNAPKRWRTYSQDERGTPAVKLVFDLLVPHLGYTDKRIVNSGQWGIARKPMDEQNHRSSANGALRRIFDVLPHR
jgi:predicted O-methyltransferase YrrM